MRIFISLFLCCLSAFVWAGSWGGLEDFDEPAVNGSPSANPSGVGARYLLPQVLEGKPVRVWVTSDDPELILLSGEEESEEKVAKYKRIVTENYARWFSEPAKIIRSSGREAEFADVLPVLDRGISVQFVNSKQNPDLIVSAVSLERLWRECPGAAGCYILQVEDEWRTPQILLPKPNFWQTLITMGKLNPKHIGQHETGHSLGLSDQYEQARSGNSHPLYHTAESDKSVMNTSASITCDDADGIINLIDLVRGSSRGGELGWRSLCRGKKTYYVKGKPVSSGPYAVKEKEGGRRWVLQTFRNGEETKRVEFDFDLQAGISPFSVLKEFVKERDTAGRAVYAQGPRGEEIFYSYVYDKRVRLVTRNDRVLLAEVTQPARMGRRSFKYSQKNYFGEEGNISLVGWEKAGKGKNKMGVAFYNVYTPSGVLKEEIVLQFKKDGSLSDSFSSMGGGARSAADSSCAMGAAGKDAFSPAGDSGSEMVRCLEARQKEEMLREWYLRQ